MKLVQISMIQIIINIEMIVFIEGRTFYIFFCLWLVKKTDFLDKSTQSFLVMLAIILILNPKNRIKWLDKLE